MLYGSIDSQLNIAGNTYPNMRPSLSLDFINKDDIDSRITFTRNSPGTYSDKDGYLKYAANNVPRIDYNSTTGECNGLLIESSRSNLSNYTEMFEKWDGISAVIFYPNYELSPDGSITAYKLVEKNDGVVHAHSISKSFISSANTIISASIYVKSEERSSIRLTVSNVGGDGWWTGFDLANNTTYNPAPSGTATFISSNIQPLNNGWYRCSTTGILSSANNNGDLILSTLLGSRISSNYLGDNTSGLYIWGAQVEVGSFPTSYIPSVQTFTSRNSIGTYVASNGYIQTASANTARYNYNPTNLNLSPKLLLETSSTNLCPFSENLSVSGTTNTTISLNTTISPDGSLTADSLLEDSSNNTHYSSQTANTITYTSGTYYTRSSFLKYNGRQYVSVYFPSTNFQTPGRHGYFDLLNGSVANSQNLITASITPYSNGWYRCSITANATSTGTGHVGGTALATASTIGKETVPYQGDGVSGVYIWGSQVEQANSASSYIPTTDVAVTRSSDVYTSASTTRQTDLGIMSGSNLNWYNPIQGTFVVTEQTFSNGRSSSGVQTYPGVIAIDKNSSSDRFGMYFAPASGSGYISAFWRVNSVQYGNALSGVANNVPIIHSVSYGPSYVSASSNGSNYQSVATTSWPTLTNTFRIGQADAPLDGWIKNIRYYPTQLSNAQIQTITSI